MTTFNLANLFIISAVVGAGLYAGVYTMFVAGYCIDKLIARFSVSKAGRVPTPKINQDTLSFWKSAI